MNTVRIKFNKTGLASYFSHLDLQRVMARALKKSGLPVWFSQGYNPHIYMTFSLPLSLGHESVCESFDFRLNEELPEEDIINALQGTLPDGITIISAGLAVFDAKEIRWAQYKITIFDDKAKILSAIKMYNDQEIAISSKVTKKKGITEINLKELIKDVEILEGNEESVIFTAFFPAGVTYNINPNLLLEFLKSTYEINILDANILREKLFNENMDILQ